MADHAEPENSQGSLDGPKASGDRAVMPEAFISYASHDTAVAAALVEALERAGVTCWIAPRDVRAGALYADAIVRAISSARAFVLVLSESSIDSSHVGKEIERASSKKRPIIALRIDAAPLTPALEYFLSESQWVEAHAGNMPEAYAKLIDAIRGLAPAAAGAVASARPAVSAGATLQSPSKSRLTQILTTAGIVLIVGYLVVDKVWLSRRPEPLQSSVAVTPAAAPAAAAAPAVPLISEKSIAVLPFTDMTEKKDQEYFSDGLSEDLIDLLTKVPELHVPARASSFYFKGQHATIPEIARALAVTYVLEGSVRKAGNLVRVRTELIRADNGYNVWSETYDRDLKDIFKVQDDIAGRVVAALKVALPGGAKPVNADQHTDNTEAYNQYLLGQHFERQFEEAGFRHAVDAFRKAIALDPHYAAAYAGLSFAEIGLADKIGDPTGVTRSLAAAEQAIALAPGDTAGYGARGWLRTSSLWDWDGAAQDFAKVASIDADAYLGVRCALNVAQGHLTEAIALQKREVQRDPLVALQWSGLAGISIDAGDLEEARSAVQRALEIEPDFSIAKMDLAELELIEGRPDQALVEAQGIKDPVWKLLTVAIVEHSLHHASESQQALDALIRDRQRDAAYQIAEVYAWRGDTDQAFAWFDRAYRQRDGGMVYLKTDYFLKSVRSDPRYAALLRRMKLPE